MSQVTGELARQKKVSSTCRKDDLPRHTLLLFPFPIQHLAGKVHRWRVHTAANYHLQIVLGVCLVISLDTKPAATVLLTNTCNAVGCLQDVVTREGKLLFLYKRPGQRVIVDAKGCLIVRPTHIEASVQRDTAGISSILARCLSPTFTIPKEY